jgi:hypothetical protein
LQKALELKWDQKSIKSAFHIFDAPGHGKEISKGENDDYPQGSPDGYILAD